MCVLNNQPEHASVLLARYLVKEPSASALRLMEAAPFNETRKQTRFVLNLVTR